MYINTYSLNFIGFNKIKYNLIGGPFTTIAYFWDQAIQYMPKIKRLKYQKWFKDEFSKLVKSIRNVEIMLGENEKRLQKEEINMKKVSSKSITIVNSKKLNSVVKLSDIKMMRPGVLN